MDKRPDPKPRKHPRLWQAYLIWDELVEMRKHHTLRLSSIEAGKSNLDAEMEKKFLARIEMNDIVQEARDEMVEYGQDMGDIWEWITSIHGLGSGGMAAQLLAQIDDISRFDTVSKLWRFCGQAVIDGKAERGTFGEKSHFSRKLKSLCWLISDQFIKSKTPVYTDIYYREKEELRRKYPEKTKNGNGKWMYNDGHIHNMAKRKMVKIFLSHLWVEWRKSEGLPVSQPYVQAILGHTNIIEP